MAAKDSTCVLPHTCVTCGALFTPLKFRKRERVFRAYTGRQNCSAECAAKAKGKVTAKRMKETRNHWIGPNNPMWTGSCLRKNKSYRGPNWPQIAQSARKRDKYKCQCCGITNDDHVNKCGKVLAVHHIVPFSEFTDHVAANRLRNLITLCSICHATADRAVKGRQLVLDLSDGSQKREKSLKPRPPTSDATRLKISIANKGKFVSAETRAKQSAARMGVRPSHETREKLRVVGRGRKHTEETKQKIRKAHEGKTHSKEWIANYVASRLKNNKLKKVAISKIAARLSQIVRPKPPGPDQAVSCGYVRPQRAAFDNCRVESAQCPAVTALRSVQPFKLDWRQEIAERIKRRPRPDGMWQCNRCGSRASMTLESGVVTRNGRKQGGTVIEKDICAPCWKRGVVVQMRPELNAVE